MKATFWFFPPPEMITCLITNKANMILCWDASNPYVAFTDTLHLI